MLKMGSILKTGAPKSTMDGLGRARKSSGGGGTEEEGRVWGRESGREESTEVSSPQGAADLDMEVDHDA